MKRGDERRIKNNNVGETGFMTTLWVCYGKLQNEVALLPRMN